MAEAERRKKRVWGAVMLLVATTTGIAGCLSPGPTVVPAPEFTTSSPRLPAAAPRARSTPTDPQVARQALPPEWQPQATPRHWQYLVLHHSGTSRGDINSIDAEHRTRTDSQGEPWLGIGYHFVIGNGHGMADGAVEPTFRWRDQLHGAHAGDRQHNDAGIGICLIGDFEQQRPTTRQLASASRLLAALAEQYQIATSDMVLHREIAATQCPGRHFDLEPLLAQSPAAE